MWMGKEDGDHVYQIRWVFGCTEFEVWDSTDLCQYGLLVNHDGKDVALSEVYDVWQQSSFR